MDKLVIEGGKQLSGLVSVSGAKNSALPIMAACILNHGKNILRNIPPLRDVKTMMMLLETMGARCYWKDDQTLIVDTSCLESIRAPYELVKTMRASILVLGPLLARFGKAEVSLPGGCAIGPRPVNLHIDGMRALGATVSLEHGYINAEVRRQLVGAHITLDISTVTGTENLMMAALGAKEETEIHNAAKEPEVEDLGRALCMMGANISGLGSDTIIIQGDAELKPIDYRIIPDRIEAGTFMAAAAITGGEIHIKDCYPHHLDAVMEKLVAAGCQIKCERDSIFIQGAKYLKPVQIETQIYPGFPTDMQAQLMAVLTLAKGSSMVTETIYQGRFMHVAELNRLGADITLKAPVAMIKGVKELIGAEVMATDLRASASLVLAGLAAKDTTEVHRIYHLERGYYNLDEKLRNLGAKVYRVDNSQ